MPIKPPNLDDRRYADLVAEARSLIPQYCPEWTNLNDADPGMTLVQLFAWMTEMIVFRLNRVPDKTYIHFLNFIGEERRPALPAAAPVTFDLRGEQPVEIPAFTRVSTRQREEARALPFLTVAGLTVHGAAVQRVMAVRGGHRPAVREIPWNPLDGHRSALSFGGGRGVQLFDLDPLEYGPESYTSHQYLYVQHDDLRLMDGDPEEDGRPVGRLHIRRSSSTSDGLSIVDLFDWEYPTADGWRSIRSRVEDEALGMDVRVLDTALPGIRPLEDFRIAGEAMALPEPVKEERWWIRGRLAYERWLARRMNEDLEISWRDDRSGTERPINNWEVREAGRAILFALQDVPPIRGGWTVRLALVDRGMPAGQHGYLPTYRWSYRRGDTWEPIPAERVRGEGTAVTITGPLPEMATDGFNLRAERVETVFLRGLCPDLELELSWVRPVEVALYAGDDPRRLEELLLDEGPWSPFQLAPVIPPTIGRKWYVGSDLFENRRQLEVLVEVELAFEVNGEPVAEPVDDYQLQLTYRAGDNWRVVWSEDKRYAGFTFAGIGGDPEEAKKPGRRRVRIALDPKTQLKGLARHVVGDRESCWLRFELVKANLTQTDKEKNRVPVVPRIYGIRLGPGKTLGDGTYDEPLPGPKMAQVDYRDQNRRLTRVVTRATGRLSETFPFHPFIDLDEENLAVYLQFDRPLPRADRHVVHFRCRGEAFLPVGTALDWEVLERREYGRTAWQRVCSATVEGTEARSAFMLSRTGDLSFEFPDPPPVSEEGFWLRGRFRLPEGVSAEQFPALPPLTHLFLNTVEAVNLVTVRTERFSGLGVPHQVIQLRRSPVFVHHVNERNPFARPDTFPDIRLFVEGDGGEAEEWFPAREGNLLTAGKDDRLFVVDPVEGTLTFGNGIRGRMLPVGSNNVVVDIYRVVPGSQGNIGAGAICLCEDAGDAVRVRNLLPAVGGRDAETVEEIVRRAPSLLTSRNRAVTRSDFEVIAREASGEVARAFCGGDMAEDGSVEVVILPRRRGGEEVPDPFLSVGLRDHVQAWLKRRCLINVEPRVRLAAFRPIDVSLTLRLRPNAAILAVREQAVAWVRRFLDPYAGGFDGDGWPFGGTLYAQDLARLVADLPDVRHVASVDLYDMSEPGRERAGPGWEQGEGTDVLVQVHHDLFVVRRIRVVAEEQGP